jgi:hypothetical protein
MPEELTTEIVAAVVTAITTILGGTYFASLPLRWRIVSWIADAVVKRLATELVAHLKSETQAKTGQYDLTPQQVEIVHNTAVEKVTESAAALPILGKPLTKTISSNGSKLDETIIKAVRRHKGKPM